MTDKIINFPAKKKAKADEVEAFRTGMDNSLERHTVVGETIQRMREISSDEDVVKSLRVAVDVFEGRER